MVTTNPFRGQVASEEAAEMNRDYPWAAGFNAMFDSVYFNDPAPTLVQAIDEADIYACSDCYDPSSIANDPYSSGCQYSWDTIATKNFGGVDYARAEWVRHFFNGARAAASVLEFSTKEASHV
jgi:hypothetical protein